MHGYLHGSSFLEISSVLTYIPISYFQYFVYGFILLPVKTPIWFRLLLEYFLILPGLLAMTLLNDHSLLINISLFTLCIVVLFLYCIASRKRPQSAEKGTHAIQYPKDKKQFLYNFRAFILKGVVWVILAVDFNVFPGRFHKSNLYGSSLMDTGVGSFIFTNAVVSYTARGVTKDSNNKLKNTLKIIASCSPILIIGVLRLAVLHAVNYGVNVSEYGVHWNFFFTLASVKICSEIILIFLPRIFINQIGFIGIALCVLHQYLLSNGVADYIMFGSRGDGSRDASYLDANREGIISCIGFLALYFISVQVGKELFKPISKGYLLTRLIILDGIFWLATFSFEKYIKPSSRRMCNGTYIVWMLALNTYLLSFSLAMEIVQEYILQILQVEPTKNDPENPPILPLSHPSNPNETESKNENLSYLINPLTVRAINRNQLLFFMLGNLLTGIINISITTRQQNNLTAMLIIISYLLAVLFVTVVFHSKNITTKIW